MNATLSSPLTLDDVQCALRGGPEIDDVDFQETLAAYRCVIIAPWVCRVKENGNLEKITTLRYDQHRHMDRAHVLTDVLRRITIRR